MERTDIKQTENEQTEVAAHTAEADISMNNGAAATEVSLGKFKDVNSLLKAYENLESEFTRRSRRLRELEGEMLRQKEEITRRGASSASEEHFGEGKPTTVGISESKENADNDGLSVKNNGKSVETKPRAEGENAGALKTDEKSTGERLENKEMPENVQSAGENNPAGEKTANEKIAGEDTPAGEKTANEKIAGENKPAEDSRFAGAGENKPADEAEEIVQAYLLSVLKSRPSFSPALGMAVTAPPRRPRSFEEAGKMIKTDLDK